MTLLIVATPYEYILHMCLLSVHTCLSIAHIYETKEPYKRDDNLQKRPIILRSLPMVATPYLCICLSIAYVYEIGVYIWRQNMYNRQ